MPRRPVRPAHGRPIGTGPIELSHICIASDGIFGEAIKMPKIALSKIQNPTTNAINRPQASLRSAEVYRTKEKELGEPTKLILVDEADRLKITSLEQLRAIFDQGNLGLVLMACLVWKRGWLARRSSTRGSVSSTSSDL